MKRIYRWMTSTWKDAELHESSGNAKETTLKYHCTLIKKAKKIKNKKSDNPKCWKRCGETSLLIHCWWECKPEQLFWKRVWQFLNKTKYITTVRPAPALWDREVTGYVYTEVGTQRSEQFFIFHCPKPETTQMPFSRWMNKQTVFRPHHEILLSNKKDWTNI